MDLIRLLPYEILQHVASSLLPRHQCRLALTSRHCYRYLYSYLLRWHAKWRLIPVPRYKCEEFSLIEVNGAVTFYTYNYREYVCRIHNLSRDMIYRIEDGYMRIHIGKFIGSTHGININYFLEKFNACMFDGFYKYICSHTLKQIAIIRGSPLLKLPPHIMRNIKKYLLNKDISVLCDAKYTI